MHFSISNTEFSKLYKVFFLQSCKLNFCISLYIYAVFKMNNKTLIPLCKVGVMS